MTCSPGNHDLERSVMSTDTVKVNDSDPDMDKQKPEISISEVINLYKLGYSSEDIADECEHLTIAEVYAALDHYFANVAKTGNLEAIKDISTPTGSFDEAFH